MVICNKKMQTNSYRNEGEKAFAFKYGDMASGPRKNKCQQSKNGRSLSKQK